RFRSLSRTFPLHRPPALSALPSFPTRRSSDLVDAEWYRPDPTAARAERPTFLYVGRLKRYKGVEIALRALAEARRARPEVTLERSEEHTSELQSPDHLVCRLLLEKKKTKSRR